MNPAASRAALATLCMAFLGALAGCPRKEGGDTSATASTSAPAASSPAPAASPAPSASSSAHRGRGNVLSTLCEVEARGKVTGVPKGKKGAVVVTIGDCLDPNSKLSGRSHINPDGTFFIEVFVNWGTDITVCAVAEPEPGKPTTTYGKLDRSLHVEGTGEVEFKDLEIALSEGPSHTFQVPPAASVVNSKKR